MRRVACSWPRRYNRRCRGTAVGLLAGVLYAAIAPCAHAALGRPYASVAEDGAHLSARMASAHAGAQMVHTLTAANGSVIKEFTGADGVVFAVSWRGPGHPDLRQLLGDHFETFQTDNVRVAGRRTRAPMTVERSDLIVRTGGHPGAFWGLAYLPPQLPAGVSVASLR